MTARQSNTRAAAMRPLKHCRRYYKVDAYARVLFPKADRATAVEADPARGQCAAQVAILRERHERHDLRAAREQAQHLDRLLTTFKCTTGWLPPGDAAATAADMAAGFAQSIGFNGPPPARASHRKHQRATRHWHSNASLHHRAAAAVTLRSAGEVFRHAMTAAFKAIRERNFLSSKRLLPPRSRKGPFVDCSRPLGSTLASHCRRMTRRWNSGWAGRSKLITHFDYENIRSNPVMDRRASAMLRAGKREECK